MKSKEASMKKLLVIIALLCICPISYAQSLERFINKYKEASGASYIVLNKDHHFNDVSEGMGIPKETQQVISGTLRVAGIEEMVALRLDSCAESVRKMFVEHVGDAIPTEYTLLSEKGVRSVHMSNSDTEYAYMLIVNAEAPGLTLLYVTNAFVRAVMNEEGTGIDLDKFEQYVERTLESLEESLQSSGEQLREGLKRWEKRIRKRIEEWENATLEVYAI